MASLLLVAAVLALAVTGGWLIVAFPFPNLAILPGVAMVGLAVALRPRFGRLDPDLEVLSRDGRRNCSGWSTRWPRRSARPCRT